MENKSLKISYWALLLLFTVGILLSAVPSVLKLPYAVEHFCNVLKLPEYLLVFTGALKLAGLVILYIPGSFRLKEWTFAGFTFDLAGAWYCNFRAMNSFSESSGVILYIIVFGLLYFVYNKLYVLKPAIK